MKALQGPLPAASGTVPGVLAGEYEPHPRWTGGHRMTIYIWARPRRFPRLPAPERRYFDVAPGARVLAHCYWQPAPQACPTLLGLHGLEGSSASHYMFGLADKALAAGFNFVALNQRNCGGTDHLSDGLYHSGLSADPAAVIRELTGIDRLPSIALVGYSLGGNVALKLAGEYGAAPPPPLHSVCAVSPTVDLALCVTALERRANLLYQWNFMRQLRKRMRRKARLHPAAFTARGLRRIRTVRAFDERYTAPHHGFAGAADYYHRSSALRVIDRITVPTLIVSAADDPFVPASQFSHPAVTGNPAITVKVTPSGGHCAFFSTPDDRQDGYWAESTAVAFAAAGVRPGSDQGPTRVRPGSDPSDRECSS